MPESPFSGEYLHKNIYEMAAAYLFHLCQNHPFVDGNKRVGLASALVFFELNGVTLEDPGGDLYDMVIKVTAGEIKKREMAEILIRLAEDNGSKAAPP
jgi:death-on-curing protein